MRFASPGCDEIATTRAAPARVVSTIYQDQRRHLPRSRRWRIAVGRSWPPPVLMTLTPGVMTTAGVIYQTAGSPHELEQPRRICHADRVPRRSVPGPAAGLLADLRADPSHPNRQGGLPCRTSSRRAPDSSLARTRG